MCIIYQRIQQNFSHYFFTFVFLPRRIRNTERKLKLKFFRDITRESLFLEVNFSLLILLGKKKIEICSKETNARKNLLNFKFELCEMNRKSTRLGNILLPLCKLKLKSNSYVLHDGLNKMPKNAKKI